MINPNELLQVVDDDDRPITKLTRAEVHRQMLQHRISDVWIINEKQQVLSQKRSLEKDNWPGTWECWFGGHVLSDESYLSSAVAETKEEIGLKITAGELHTFGKRKVNSQQERIFITIYGMRRSIDIDSLQLEAEEVHHVEWFSIDELRKIYQGNNDRWVQYGHELEVLAWLEQLH